MKIKKILIILLPFIAPAPVIIADIYKPYILENFGNDVSFALFVLSIIIGIALFSTPFVQMLGVSLPFFSGGGYESFWGAGKKAKNVLQTGHQASAEIVRIGENSGGGTLTINQQPVLNIVVRINSDMQQPYESNMDVLIPRSQVPMFQPGAVFPVKVSREDPAFFVLDDSLHDDM